MSELRRWRKAIFIVAACVLLIIGLAVWRWRVSHFDWGRFFSTLTEINWTWLILAIVLMLLTYVGRALRWEVMLRPLRPHPSLWNLCSATVIGFTAVVILGRPGELVRPYLIAIKERVPFSSQMAVWLLERVLDTIAVLLIFGFALTRMPAHSLHVSTLQWLLKAGGYIVALICAACVLFLFIFRNFSETAQRRVLSAVTFLPDQHYKRVESSLAAFVQGMQSTRDHSFLALLLGYTVLEWVVIVAGYYFVFRAFAATAGFALADVLMFVGFVALGSIIQIPGIGGGVQVASVIVLTELFGLTLESATGMALLIWVLSFLSVVPFGLAFAFHEGINWRKFRHLAAEVPG
ncbi:MAG: lysylphosphatidylglycerol synthase transmembrane domain-containing protein [Bryobacteraceae bacterium]